MALPNTLSPSGVEISLASHKDYEGVMDIDRNMYDGVDYLPWKYMEYLKDPRRMCVVSRIGGKIVAFHMFYIVDEGMTFS